MKEYTNSQVSGLIDEYIHNDKHRKMLKRRLVDGMLYEPLAEEFDLSVAQVKRIIYKGQDTISKHL